MKTTKTHMVSEKESSRLRYRLSLKSSPSLKTKKKKRKKKKRCKCKSCGTCRRENCPRTTLSMVGLVSGKN